MGKITAFIEQPCETKKEKNYFVSFLNLITGILYFLLTSPFLIFDITLVIIGFIKVKINPLKGIEFTKKIYSSKSYKRGKVIFSFMVFYLIHLYYEKN